MALGRVDRRCVATNSRVFASCPPRLVCVPRPHPEVAETCGRGEALGAAGWLHPEGVWVRQCPDADREGRPGIARYSVVPRSASTFRRAWLQRPEWSRECRRIWDRIFRHVSRERQSRRCLRGLSSRRRNKPANSRHGGAYVPDQTWSSEISRLDQRLDSRPRQHLSECRALRRSVRPGSADRGDCLFENIAFFTQCLGEPKQRWGAPQVVVGELRISIGVLAAVRAGFRVLAPEAEQVLLLGRIPNIAGREFLFVRICHRLRGR